MMVIVVLLLLLVLLILRVPVGFALAAAGSVGVLSLGGSSMLLGVLQSAPASASTYSLTPIPLFILMAQFVLYSGVMDDIFVAARTWVGRTRGGTGIATTLSGAVFGAISGSSTAAAATLAKTASTQLIAEGYRPRVATGMVAVAGTLAAMVPPSIILIFYAILAEQSVGKILIAGIVPAVFVTASIIAALMVLIVLRPDTAPKGQPYSFSSKLKVLPGVLPVLVLFLLVTGTVYFGVATPTEASALGALGGFVIYLLKRGFKLREIGQAIVATTHSSVMILFIMLGAAILGYYVTMSGVTREAVDLVGSLNVAPILVISLIAIGYIMLGFVLEQMAILALTVPVVLPIVVELGYDPIWFGVLVVLLAEIGLVSPPLGLNVFVVARATRRESGEVFLGTIPFVLGMLCVVALFIFFPEIVMWLPNNM